MSESRGELQVYLDQISGTRIPQPVLDDMQDITALIEEESNRKDKVREPYLVVSAGEGKAVRSYSWQGNKENAKLSQTLKLSVPQYATKISVTLHDAQRDPDYVAPRDTNDTAFVGCYTGLKRKATMCAIGSDVGDVPEERGYGDGIIENTGDNRRHLAASIIAGRTIDARFGRQLWSQTHEIELVAQDGQVAGLLSLDLHFTPYLRSGWIDVRNRKRGKWFRQWGQVIGDGHLNFFEDPGDASKVLKFTLGKQHGAVQSNSSKPTEGTYVLDVACCNEKGRDKIIQLKLHKQDQCIDWMYDINTVVTWAAQDQPQDTNVNKNSNKQNGHVKQQNSV
eukprot:TRINITY_DN6916_c1_g2_i3.p1 TRINITY_DN6916_c1_g2~~TRINITY_DN6916_c1_g2_i3.p1  ORF type:complete len:337 (+),score=54.07 TRINITY_DN6916_c1_g2_i3:110-1120(+)